MSDSKTIKVYDSQAAEYAQKTDEFNAGDPRLMAFIAGCPTGGRVLDLGCGPGAAAATMAKAGLQVDAMDASAEMVAMAARSPGVTAWQASFDQITQQACYDGVWANFSLLHAPRAAFPDHLAAIRLALKPNGVFFIALKLGDGESRDKIGRFYTYYTAADLDRHLQHAGFSIMDHQYGRSAGLDGTESDWISVATHA